MEYRIVKSEEEIKHKGTVKTEVRYIVEKRLTAWLTILQWLFAWKPAVFEYATTFNDTDNGQIYVIGKYQAKFLKTVEEAERVIQYLKTRYVEKYKGATIMRVLTSDYKDIYINTSVKKYSTWFSKKVALEFKFHESKPKEVAMFTEYAADLDDLKRRIDERTEKPVITVKKSVVNSSI